MNSTTQHQSVLLSEVITALAPTPGGVYVDGTLGMGGHAEAILRATSPDGRLYACDLDPQAVAAASDRLAPYAGRFEVRQGSFADLPTWVSPASVDGVLLDLGLNSVQLSGRGFGFQTDSELDMRINPSQSLTARHWLNTAEADELSRVFWELRDERAARRIARAIERERQRQPLTTTTQLARLVERNAPRGGKAIHPATRVFLATRMHVNQEIETLQRGLAAVWSLLKPLGRLAVVSFHSGEHRLVKHFALRLSRDYEVPGEVDVPALRRPCLPQARFLTRKAIRPSAAELARNPRARSAQLRMLMKLPTR